MSLILAIDQSTSATKAVLFDTRGKVLDKAARSHRQIYPQPGWVEHDAEEIWRNVLAVIREIAKRNRVKLSRVAALSITNQRETVVVFDRKTGKPLYNALVWQDRRGDAICAGLRKRNQEDFVRNCTGLKIDTYFSGSKIRWLIENCPSIARQLKSGNAVVGTTDTYLVHRLTNGEVFATDHTNASRTLLFDIKKLCWDRQLRKLFKVPESALPEVRESSSHFGETNANGILSKHIPIIGVMGDSQASLFAQRCFLPGMAKATFGTGTSVLLNIGRTPKMSKTGAVTALAWVYRGKPVYAFEGLINFSAATIEWLKNQLGLIQNLSEVGQASKNIFDNAGVYLIPAFAGLSAPYWSPDTRAAIIGLTAHSRKEHVVRAALQSIAFQIRDVLDMMRDDAKVKISRLHADGGPTANKSLMQFTANVTGTTIVASEVAESSAWGAALNGLLGLGVYRTLDDIARLPRKQANFAPKLSRAEANRLHSGWLAAVKRIL